MLWCPEGRKSCNNGMIERDGEPPLFCSFWREDEGCLRAICLNKIINLETDVLLIRRSLEKISNTLNVGKK